MESGYDLRLGFIAGEHRASYCGNVSWSNLRLSMSARIPASRFPGPSVETNVFSSIVRFEDRTSQQSFPRWSTRKRVLSCGARVSVRTRAAVPRIFPGWHLGGKQVTRGIPNSGSRAPQGLTSGDDEQLDIVDTELVQPGTAKPSDAPRGFGSPPREATKPQKRRKDDDCSVEGPEGPGSDRWAAAAGGGEVGEGGGLGALGDVEGMEGMSLEEMEGSIRELQRHMEASLRELERTAAGMMSAAGLEVARELRQAVRAEARTLQGQMQALLEGVREVRALQEAAEQPGAPQELMERAAMRAVALQGALEGMGVAVGAAEEAVEELREEGEADMDALSSPLSALTQRKEAEWLAMESENEALRAQVAALQAVADRGGNHRAARSEKSGTTQEDTGAGMEPAACSEAEEEGDEGAEVLAEPPMATAAWEELRRERRELKEELGELLRTLVSLARGGDREGSLALAAANEELVREQVRAGEAGVEQAAMMGTLALFHFGMEGRDSALGLDLFEQSLDLCAELEPQPLLDDLLENAADVLFGFGAYAEAVPLYLKSLQVQLALTGGREHESQAATASSLANAYAEAGMLEDAIEMQGKAASMVAAARGERSLGVGTLSVRLAQLHLATGDVEDARRHAERAVSIMEERRGKDSFEAAVAACTLAEVRHAQGDDLAAVELLEAAVRRMESSLATRRRATENRIGAAAPLGGTPALGPDDLGAPVDHHPALDKAQDDLAELYDAIGRHGDALQVRQDALVAKEMTLGPGSPGLVPPLVRLGQSFLACDREEEAEAPLRRAVQLARGTVPPGHVMLAVPLEALCLCLLQLGRQGEAERLAREVVSILEKPSGAGLAKLADALVNLALVLHSGGKIGEAEAPLFRALKIFDDSLGPQNDNSAFVLSVLATVLRDQGKHEAASRIALRLERMSS